MGRPAYVQSVHPQRDVVTSYIFERINGYIDQPRRSDDNARFLANLAGGTRSGRLQIVQVTTGRGPTPVTMRVAPLEHKNVLAAGDHYPDADPHTLIRNHGPPNMA